MRNIFDQYKHAENRLTHALMSSLDADQALLRRFIRWTTGKEAPTGRLDVLEQTLPCEEEPRDEDEAEGRGLPDGCIHRGNSWALIIESKIGSPLTLRQLECHRSTLEKRGFTNLHLLAIVVELPKFQASGVTIKKWAELYSWLMDGPQSEWIRRLTAYMEVLERRLIDDKRLEKGTLTVFTGIPFGKEDTPYKYDDAKRVIRLAMDKLRVRNGLQQELGMDPTLNSRKAITGKKTSASGVWDYLQLASSKGAGRFTEFPHLTFGIHREEILAIVTVPNGIQNGFRRNLLADGKNGFYLIFESVLANLTKSLGSIEGAVPWMEIVQRHYKSQRSEPMIDAKLQFDLRTGFDGHDRWPKSVKQQPQWLEATYETLSAKKSNVQLGVGAIFRYQQCKVVAKPEILDHVASVWLGCKPLINKMIR